jgi:3-phosphoshikimate 1-carboxyvinyltransferase
MSRIQVRNGAGNIKASIQLPASKSISNRLLMIKALCSESFEIENLSQSDDTRVLQDCIENLDKVELFDVNDAATPFRFLTALLAIMPNSYTLTGSKQLMKRPVSNLVNALNKLGADITYAAKKYHPPLIIKGAKFSSRIVTIDAGISSQFISALLLIAPALPKGIILKLSGNIASKPYINMTLKMMEYFGVNYVWEQNKITIEKQEYKPRKFVVEADWSAAVFWYQIVALSKNTEIELIGLKQYSLQGDASVAGLFDKLGVRTSFLPDSVLLTKKETPAVVLIKDFFHTPDLFPPAVSTCAGLNIPFRFTGLKNLLIKESDRVLSMVTELAKFGYYFNYDKDADVLVYDGNKGAFPDADINCNSYNDHRIAMSLAPMSLLNCTVNLTDSECISKSYPDYYNDLSKAGFSIK